MKQRVAQLWQGMAQPIVILCVFSAGFLIIHSNGVNLLFHHALSTRSEFLAIFIFLLSVIVTIYAWKYVKRFTTLIVVATFLALLMQNVPRVVEIIQVSLCSLVISLLLWSVIQEVPPQRTALPFLRKLSDLWIITGVISIIYITITVMHHLSLNFTGFDLGIFTQEVYKYAHFEGIYNSIKDQNIFVDHFSPFLMLLTPIWWIWPGATMLLVLQVVALCSGGVVIYKIADHLFHDRLIAWCIATAYLLAPSIQGPLATDFHEIVFVPVGLLLLFYFQLKQKYVRYWITFIILLFVKEDVALYLIAWSLFYGVTTKRWKDALAGIIISATYFLVVMKGIMPRYTGTVDYQYFRMGPLGNSPSEAIKTILTRPLLAVRQFFGFDTVQHPSFPSDTKLFTQVSLLAVFGFLPILAPITLIFAAPILVEQFWLDFPYHWGLTFHYATPLTPVLVIATLLALVRIPHHLARFKLNVQFSSKDIQHILALFVLMSSIAYSVSQRTLITDILHPSLYHIGSRERQALALTHQIPRNASVATNAALLPHIAGRSYIITWPGFSGEGGVTGFKDKPLNTDYAILSIAGAPWIWRPDESLSHMDAAVHTPGYGLVAMSDDGWTILVKHNATSNPELLDKWEKIKPTLLTSE